MFEYLIVAVLVLWSAVVVFKKVFPQTANAAFLALSNLCQRLGWQRLATWLKPKMLVQAGRWQQVCLCWCGLSMRRIVCQHWQRYAVKRVHGSMWRR